MVQLGLMILVLPLIWVGIQGLRGVADSKGNTTGKPVAVACLIFAVLVAVFALIVLPQLAII